MIPQLHELRTTSVCHRMRRASSTRSTTGGRARLHTTPRRAVTPRSSSAIEPRRLQQQHQRQRRSKVREDQQPRLGHRDDSGRQPSTPPTTSASTADAARVKPRAPPLPTAALRRRRSRRSARVATGEWVGDQPRDSRPGSHGHRSSLERIHFESPPTDSHVSCDESRILCPAPTDTAPGCGWDRRTGETARAPAEQREHRDEGDRHQQRGTHVA